MENLGWRLPPNNETSNPTEITTLRGQIDAIDDEIARLLNTRLLLAQQIGAEKASSGKPVKDELREKKVLERVCNVASNELIAQGISAVYKTILEESCSLQAEIVASTICARAEQNQSKESQTRADSPKTLYFPRVLIIGVGLIGGALAHQIKARLPKTVIAGCDDAAVLAAAMEAGLIDHAESDPTQAVKNASLIILCAPPAQNLKLLEQIAPSLKRRQIVIDVTSAKARICELAQELSMKADFIGGHPFFGSHQKGLAHASELNLVGKTFCLVPTKQSSDIALRRLQRWLGDLGMRCEIATAAAHDETVAATSHLVQILATSLGAILAGEDAVGAKSKATLSGPALKGISRLMNSPAHLWTDILNQNGAAVCQALDTFTAELSEVRDQISSGKTELLEQRFEKAQKFARLIEE